MLRTTVPSFVIALTFFLIIGFFREGGFDNSDVLSMQSSLKENFNISLWLLLVPVITFGLILAKVDTLLSLIAGIATACIFAAIFQTELVFGAAQGLQEHILFGYKNIMTALYGSFGVSSANPMIGDLLSSGGMYGMLNTVWLIISAMVFGGVMEASGFLQTITMYIARVVKSEGSAIAATSGTCIFVNLTSSDQYLSLVVPGRMFPSFYKKFNLAPENLSRTLEDSGTVTSALIPWNTCGAYHAGVLGVATMTYAPFAVFNYVSPIITILVANFGNLRKNNTTSQAINGNNNSPKIETTVEDEI
jgi:NhaC family Na+:H+ antiporter